MSKINPMDLAFFLLENTSRQMHMTAYQMFKVPSRQKDSFVAKVLSTYRNSEVAAPFNQKLKWLGKNVASWQKVQPDLNYHVRHVAVPAPGTLQQFYELISFLNTPLLDRALPPNAYILESAEPGPLESRPARPFRRNWHRSRAYGTKRIRFPAVETPNEIL